MERPATRPIERKLRPLRREFRDPVESPPREAAERSVEVVCHQLVSSLRNGVIAITRDGTVSVINGMAYRILAIDPDPDDVGRHITVVLRNHPDIVRIFSSAFELSYLPNRDELRLKPSGKVIGHTLSIIHDQHNRPTGAALFFKDLTHIEQIEERERLRDRLAALGEMAATIAHEVKNPLASIEVMAGLLRRQFADSPDAQVLLTDIINEAKMANAIVIECLEYVRPIRLQLENTSLLDVMRDAVTLAESQTMRGSIEIVIDVPSGLPEVEGDGHQLRQLFTNLLRNAFEAMDGHGRITIRASVSHQEEDDPTARDPVPASATLIVEVIDTGPGINAEAMDRVFNAFFTTKTRGSGLGLAIVRRIVDAHNGRIDVTSEPGRGACFRVTLPVAGAQSWA